jgi:hypothetical protein
MHGVAGCKSGIASFCKPTAWPRTDNRNTCDKNWFGTGRWLLPHASWHPTFRGAVRNMHDTLAAFFLHIANI